MMMLEYKLLIILRSIKELQAMNEKLNIKKKCMHKGICLFAVNLMNK